MSQICVICKQPFDGREGAKTCSPKCRKALSRGGYKREKDEPYELTRDYRQPPEYPQMSVWSPFRCCRCRELKEGRPTRYSFYYLEGLRSVMCQACWQQGWRFDEDKTLLHDRLINVTENDLQSVDLRNGADTDRFRRFASDGFRIREVWCGREKIGRTRYPK